MSWHDELVNWFVYSLSKSPETIRYCLVFAETVSQSLSLVLLYIFTQSQLFEELQGFSLYNSFPVTLLYCCGYHTFFYYLFSDSFILLWISYFLLLSLNYKNFLRKHLITFCITGTGIPFERNLHITDLVISFFSIFPAIKEYFWRQFLIVNL